MAPFSHLLLFTTLLFDVTPEQVVITPPGPLAIPVNTQKTINCTTPMGGLIQKWEVLLKNAVPLSLGNVPGITAVYDNSNSILTINTTNTSVIGLHCIGFKDRQDSMSLMTTRINLTIYGPPAPPENVSSVVYGNSVFTSWMFYEVEEYNVSYHLRLTFFKPSLLANKSIPSLMNSYNFTVKGLRSCDYFTFCVRASNNAGLGEPACTNGSLLYIPTTNNIKYSLSRAGEHFMLTATVTIPNTCLVNLQNTMYILEVSGEYNETIRSHSVPADSNHSLQVNNLIANRTYWFRIKSNNSLNNGSSIEQELFVAIPTQLIRKRILTLIVLTLVTSDVQSINICSTNENGVFLTACNYISGSNSTGCGYRLTRNGSNQFERKIMKDDSIEENIPNIKTYENIIITDIYGTEVINKTFSSKDIMRCNYTTGPTSNSTETTSNNSRNSRIILAIIIVVVMLITVILVISIAVPIFLRWHGYCFHLPPKHKNNEVSVVGASTDTSIHLKVNNVEQQVVTPDNSQGEYSTLAGVHKQEENQNEKIIDSEYSHFKSEPLYHVLEKETPIKNENITEDPDAPVVPPFCPSGGDTPPHSEVQNTTSTVADFMYAEVGNVRAKK